MTTPFEPVTYTADWQRPEWIYAQVLELTEMVRTPEMREMRENKETRPRFLKLVREKFSVLELHYKKIFMYDCFSTSLFFF